MQDARRHDPVPTYEGRAMARPEEEVVDQGLCFDLTTLLSRRRVLRVLGLGAATAGGAACTGPAAGPTARSGPATTPPGAVPGEIPEETAGPFPGDGSNGPDVLAESGVVRSDIRSSFGPASGTAAGVPMRLELTISDLADGGSAFAGAAVYVWHCDREGRYSMYSDGVEDQNHLRGVQIADAAGLVGFTSIVPACYPGRWPHVHFEVYPDQAGLIDATTAIATSQVALPQDLCEQVYAEQGYEASVAQLSRLSLEDDIVFRDDSGASQLATTSGDVATGYTVSLAVGIDTTTSAGRR